MTGSHHILFLTHYFPPEGNAPASRVYSMAKRWVKSGHRVTVITCAPNVPNGIIYDGYRNRLSQRETIDGIEVIRVWTFIAANRGVIKRSINYLSYLVSATLRAIFVRRPDLVIATSPQFFCGLAGVFVSRLKRVPLLLEIRDIWPASIIAVGAIGTKEQRQNSLAIRFLERLERWLYRAARHIVTVGPGYRDELLKRDVPAQKVSIIPNGVNTDLYRPCNGDSGVIRDRHGISHDAFVVSYIGTIGLASSLDVVLRAAQQLKRGSVEGLEDVRFLIVGDGACRAELERQARAQDLDNVLFAGRRPKEEMPSYLASTDVCLVHLARRPLFRTVLPSKIFEAAAMRRPIILGVEGSTADLVREADAGLCIEPENEQQLIDAIRTLHGDRALRERLAASGFEYFVTHYNLGELAQRYLDVIDQAVTGSPVEATETGAVSR